MFLLGLVGFTAFSAACAMSQGIGMLIAFRALQGGFGALMIPQGFGLLKEVFDDGELGRATRLFGPSTGLALLGAPVLAGALIDANLWDISWRRVFLINVPIGLIAFPLAIRSLPRGASHPGLSSTSAASGSSAWRSWRSLPAYPGPGRRLEPGRSRSSRRAVLLYVFVRYERRRSHNALIEPSLLANRMYLSGIAVMLSLFGAFGGLLLCVSLYGHCEGWSPIHAGLTLTPMVVGMIVGMVVSGMLVSDSDANCSTSASCSSPPAPPRSP